MTERLLTTGEIAKYCNVTDRAVLKWVKQEKIRSHATPGGHSRIKLDDFIRFLEEYNMPVPEDLKARAGRKKKILVVDDDRPIAKTISNVLTKNDKYEVQIAYDGFVAGFMISEFKPDLITLDLMMPVLDGFEVCKKIRDNKKYDQMKILIVSGVEDEQAKEKVIDLGADGFLVKPISSSVLLKKVDTLVKAKKRS